MLGIIADGLAPLGHQTAPHPAAASPTEPDTFLASCGGVPGAGSRDVHRYQGGRRSGSRRRAKAPDAAWFADELCKSAKRTRGACSDPLPHAGAVALAGR